VNQGRSYEGERAAGIVFAGTGGPQVSHHLNVGRMTTGDVVVHYRRGEVLAFSEVVTDQVRAERPYGPHADRDQGWLTRVEYFPLDGPIALGDLPERDGDEGRSVCPARSSRATFSRSRRRTHHRRRVAPITCDVSRR